MSSALVRVVLEARGEMRRSALCGFLARRPRGAHDLVVARGDGERFTAVESDDESRARMRACHLADERRLDRVNHVADLDVEPPRSRSRPEDHRAGDVRLRPLELIVVEPVRSAVDLDAETKLAQTLLAVGMRPPEPFDAAAPGNGREQRPVPEHGCGKVQLPHGATSRQFGTVSPMFCVPSEP